MAEYERELAFIGSSDHALRERTAVEPAEPLALTPESEALLLVPFVYWPVTEDAKRPEGLSKARSGRPVTQASLTRALGGTRVK